MSYLVLLIVSIVCLTFSGLIMQDITKRIEARDFKPTRVVPVNRGLLL